MSYDLGIWHSEKKLDLEEAAERYQSLCESPDSPFSDHPALEAFYSELIEIFPEIDSLPDDQADNTEICPWTNAIDKSQGAFIVSCVFSQAERVHEVIHELAAVHGLTVFDPQTGTIAQPE